MPAVAQWLKDKYSPAYRVSTSTSSYCCLKCRAPCNKDAAAVSRLWGKSNTFDNSKAKEILGIEFRNAKESVYAMADKLLSNGYIPAKGATPQDPKKATQDGEYNSLGQADETKDMIT